MHYLWSEKKDADQPCCNCTADLRLCFRICRLLFFYAAAQLCNMVNMEHKVSIQEFFLQLLYRVSSHNKASFELPKEDSSSRNRVSSVTKSETLVATRNACL